MSQKTVEIKTNDLLSSDILTNVSLPSSQVKSIYVMLLQNTDNVNVWTDIKMSLFHVSSCLDESR